MLRENRSKNHRSLQSKHIFYNLAASYRYTTPPPIDTIPPLISQPIRRMIYVQQSQSSTVNHYSSTHLCAHSVPSNVWDHSRVCVSRDNKLHRQKNMQILRIAMAVHQLSRNSSFSTGVDSSFSTISLCIQI